MSDVTVAAEQDAIAESLLGDEPQETQVETPEAEQPVIEEQVAEPAEQSEQIDQEAAENWLPTEQDKVFPDEVIGRYAERMGLTAEQAQEPTVRQLLVNKLNTDIYVQQLEARRQEEESETVEPTPEQTQPQLSREQYFQNLDRMIAERTDPEVAKAFHGDFLRAFGVPDAEIAKIPPQQAQAFTQTASKYMLNLMNTFMDDMLGARMSQQISTAFPGFADMYNRSSHAMAWDGVRNSNPQFASLPAYGSKEFTSTLRQAAQRIPEVADMINEAEGKPMNQAQVTRWYTMLARIATGQNVDLQALKQAAAQAGARNARRASAQRSAANLGSGKSNSASGNRSQGSRFQSNQDIFDDATMDMWDKEHGRL